jgi:hypothetical protein
MSQNETVVFYPSGHVYIERSSGRKLTSVSDILNYYEGPFDSEFWSLYKGIEHVFDTSTARFARFNYPYGDTELERIKIWIEQETVTGEKRLIEKHAKEKKEHWRRLSYNARKAGSNRHDKLERAINKADVIIKNNIPYEPMPRFLCDKADFESRGIATEVTVYNLYYMVSGRVDRVDKDGRDIEIVDYKTSKEIEYENKWQNFKHPLNYLQKCNFNRYLLQMNTYGWMFSQFGFNVKKLTLVHDRTKKEIDVPINFEDVVLMLNHWKSNGSKAKTSRSSNKKAG